MNAQNAGVNIPEHITAEEAARPPWDVIVLGAGPAGSLAARQLARGKLRVLLVDKVGFPRSKVCGCCLNQAALTTLADVGLRELPVRAGAQPYNAFDLSVMGRRVRLQLPGGLALSRARLDAALATEAVALGATFLPDTTALGSTVAGTWRTVNVRCHSQRLTLRGRLVLLAAGLGADLEKTGDQRVSSNSRIGLGTVISGVPEVFGDPVIYMGCGPHGYVGLVRVEDDCLNVAAAVDRSCLSGRHDPRRAVEAILRSSGLPVPPGLRSAAFRGTPALTRTRQSVAGERLFVIGDAAGYVEPFTGEGMTWALMSAVLVEPLAVRAVQRWQPALEDEWRHRYRTAIGRRQHLCRWLSWSLRRPWLVRTAVSVLRRMPSLAAGTIRSINTSNQQTNFFDRQQPEWAR